MPYIKEQARDEIRQNGGLEGAYRVTTAGELNYAITFLITAYLSDFGYQEINDVLGALEGAKLECYRRLVAPYEDKKIKENGDVYE